MSFSINRGPNSSPQNRTYLPTDFTTSTNDSWMDPGLSISVPQGSHKIRYNISGTVITDNPLGVLQMYARLYNVTDGVEIPESVRYVASACFARANEPLFNAPYSGSIQFDTLVYPSTATTYRVEIRKEVAAGTPTTTLDMTLRGNSYIEYEKVQRAT